MERRAQASVTFAKTVTKYLEEYALPRLKPKSFRETERYLTVHWKPLHGLGLLAISRAAIAGRLIEIARDSGKTAANRARAALSGFFSWAMGEGLAERNPVIGTNKAREEATRDRVLSEAELRSIWQNCRDDDYGRIIRLLVLTGQRREEVGSMTWDEIDENNGGVWSPASAN